MPVLAAFGGVTLILLILWDAFEAIVLPRRVMHKWRLARFFYRTSWALWSTIARRIEATKRRESYLSFYGPLSVLILLVIWALAMVFGFALVQWGLGSAISGTERQARLRLGSLFQRVYLLYARPRRFGPAERIGARLHYR